jgi:hypothetical protein
VDGLHAIGPLILQCKPVAIQVRRQGFTRHKLLLLFVLVPLVPVRWPQQVNEGRLRITDHACRAASHSRWRTEAATAAALGARHAKEDGTQHKQSVVKGVPGQWRCQVAARGNAGSAQHRA